MPDTTRAFSEVSPTDDLVNRLPPAPPPYSSVPSILQVGHPAALNPGVPAVKQARNDELDRVPNLVESLLAAPERLAVMRAAMLALARPEAAETIADELVALAQGSG